MGKYDELTEQRISKIIEESVESKTQANFRPLQPQAKAISVKQGRNRLRFEELQGE